MNIFILDLDPVLAAQMQCDQHVVKMITETAQMLSTSFHLRGNGMAHKLRTDRCLSSSNITHEGRAPYSPVYAHHPCTLWAAGSSANFDWLVRHGMALADEYSHRYSEKSHKSAEVIKWIADRKQELIFFPRSDLTPFALAMPEQYKQTSDAVTSYRQYYSGEKRKFARWATKFRTPPEWW